MEPTFWFAITARAKFCGLIRTGQKKDVLASGLKGPSQIVQTADQIVITERKANRVVRLSGGKAYPIGGEIVEPLGLIPDYYFRIFSGTKPPEPAPLRLSVYDSDSIYAVAHTTSKFIVLTKPNGNWFTPRPTKTVTRAATVCVVWPAKAAARSSSATKLTAMC